VLARAALRLVAQRFINRTTAASPMNHAPSFLHRRATRALALATTAAALFTSVARAEEAPPSRLHGLVGLTFSDKYLTPRGMIVQDKGLTIQTLFLGFLDVYDGDPEGILTDIGLVGGFWADYATEELPESGGAGGETNFVEIDPILGVSLGLGKNFKLDVTYTAFAMQILDIGTSHHLETKLSYNDSELLGAFALHPYLLYWKELDKKATAASNFGVDSSFYFEVGIAPGVTLGSVKLEAPMRALLPDDEFYGEAFGDASTVALYEVGLKASVPIKMPVGYGFWNAHLGVRYMNFVDDNLKQLSTSGGFGDTTDDVTQVYSGVTVFF
jgi:hypothetical protein